MADVAWHVVPGMTTQTTELAPNGSGIRDVEKIVYQIDSGPLNGNQRTITLPVELYTADNVRSAIQQDANNASEIGGLTG